MQTSPEAYQRVEAVPIGRHADAAGRASTRPLYPAIFILAAWPLPAERRFALGLPLVGIGLGASAVLTLVQLTATEADADALAVHLRASGATFDGAYRCAHCRDQRSPVGPPAVCAAAGIRAYPTWDIGGRRYEGVLPLDQLARLSGFPPLP